MTNDILQFLAFGVVLVALSIPLGAYMAKVFAGETGFVLLFLILKFQDLLPWNPLHLPGLSGQLAFNTAVILHAAAGRPPHLLRNPRGEDALAGPLVSVQSRASRHVLRIDPSRSKQQRDQLMIRVTMLSVLWLSTIMVMAVAYSFIPG